ncbi:MAG: hypothetical protein WC322_02860 [Candidatus Paceibacterota bacterium]|jgi:hypothetical protein
MAINKIFEGTPSKNREATVPAGTLPGVALIADGRPSMTVTAEPTATKSQTLANGTVITWPIGGVGNAAGKATVVVDGTYEFAVTGALTTTGNGVEVFITLASGALTLTDAGATEEHYGWTDYPVGYRKEAGRAAVRIGA